MFRVQGCELGSSNSLTWIFHGVLYRGLNSDGYHGLRFLVEFEYRVPQTDLKLMLDNP